MDFPQIVDVVLVVAIGIPAIALSYSLHVSNDARAVQITIRLGARVLQLGAKLRFYERERALG